MSSTSLGAGSGGPASGPDAHTGSGDAHTVFVLGASGDLAHKKTYPSLFDLFRAGLLPPRVLIVGYARSAVADDVFRQTIRGHLSGGTPEELDEFLKLCIYRQGKYDDAEAFRKVGHSTGPVIRRG
jgi:glucose-6-phosphate 1-dehydrogenase